jgi:histidine ammonia-lyase
VENLQRILAIELFNAAQAIEFRKPLKSSTAIQKVLADFRTNVPFVDEDIIMYTQIEASVQFLKKSQFSI